MRRVGDEWRALMCGRCLLEDKKKWKVSSCRRCLPPSSSPSSVYKQRLTQQKAVIRLINWGYSPLIRLNDGNRLWRSPNSLSSFSTTGREQRRRGALTPLLLCRHGDPRRLLDRSWRSKDSFFGCSLGADQEKDPTWVVPEGSESSFWSSCFNRFPVCRLSQAMWGDVTVEEG